MVSPQGVLDAIERALRSADALSDEVSLLTHEWDSSGSEADVNPPLITILGTYLDDQTGGDPTEQLVRARDYDGVADDSRGVIGEILAYTYEFDIECHVHTVARSDHDVAGVGSSLRSALRRYETRGTRVPLVDADGDPLRSVGTLLLGVGEPDNDLTTNQSLRGWTQELTVRFTDRVNTVDERGPFPYVKRVDAPRPGEPHDGVGDDPAIVSRPSDLERS